MYAQAQGLEIIILFKAEIHQFHYNRVWMPLCEFKAGWIFPFKTDLRFVWGGPGIFLLLSVLLVSRVIVYTDFRLSIVHTDIAVQYFRKMNKDLKIQNIVTKNVCRIYYHYRSLFLSLKLLFTLSKW